LLEKYIIVRKGEIMPSDLKLKRTKSFFINATKELILNEGVEQITVRKIAEKSGYSYATIYHYFVDLDTLLFETKNAIIMDMVEVMSMKPTEQGLTLEQVKDNNKKFLQYFINHPNVYHFLYRHPLKNSSIPLFDNLDIGEAYWDTYKGFVKSGVISKEEVPVIAKTLIYNIYGLLGLFFSSNGLTQEKVFKDMDEITDFILSKPTDTDINNKEEL
jgi:AcrR family transcriptional regulator